jgi:RNA polymerase sigma-70 factor (ECF subfamily)
MAERSTPVPDREGEEQRWRGWMAAAQDGDADAYERLLRSILPVLRAIVGRRLGDPSSVEDVVQNVLLSIHQARHTYRPERPFGPWMRAIARNAVIDAQRSRTARGRREVPIEDREWPAEAFDPVEALEELSPELTRALEALPPSQREAVELIHVQQLSVAEAAERVGISPGALRVRAHRGYKALRLRMGAGEGRAE